MKQVLFTDAKFSMNCRNGWLVKWRNCVSSGPMGMQKIIQAEGTQQTFEHFVNQVKSMEKADDHVLFLCRIEIFSRIR